MTMYQLILTIFGALAFIQSYSQETFVQPKLKMLIDSLYQADQQVQEDMIAVFQRGASVDSIKIFETVEKQAFKRHIPILQNIYKQYGYPTKKMVGSESASHFFTLVQHADADANFQLQMLPLIKKQVDKKQANGKEYAYLYDRIQINKGGEQLYGTQVSYDSSGNAVPKKLKDRDGLNKRRVELGMETIEEYLAKATAIHKQMNTRN